MYFFVFVIIYTGKTASANRGCSSAVPCDKIHTISYNMSTHIQLNKTLYKLAENKDLNCLTVTALYKSFCKQFQIEVPRYFIDRLP